jgi:dTDP-4-amino-4,6-dideoxygalactose transaminase
MEGINSRLDGIQAAILSAKLKYIDEWNLARNKNALIYNRLLSGIEQIQTPKVRGNSFHIFHLYVIRSEKRDELADFLNSKGIGTGIHYPTALPFMPAYSYLSHKPSDFPVAHQIQDEILSLPMFPELNSEQIEYVTNAIKEFFQ